MPRKSSFKPLVVALALAVGAVALLAGWVFFVRRHERREVSPAPADTTTSAAPVRETVKAPPPPPAAPPPPPAPAYDEHVAADGLGFMPLHQDDPRPPGPLHPHPITPAHERLFAENRIAFALDDATDAKDVAVMKKLLDQYRRDFPEDQWQLQGGYAVIIDTQRPDGIVSVVSSNTIPNVNGQQVTGAASITFPRDPAHLGGSDITRTYVVSSVADFATLPATNPPTPISAATGHVFLTTDGGTTWTPLHGDGTGFDLPNVRVYVIRFDPSDPTDQTMWAGTDLGVYRSTDQGQTWVRYGTNLPMVRVQDLYLSLNGSLVRAAMYGRGLWEIYPRSDGAGGATGSGDFDKNGVIDFRDLGNLTNRLTVTPAATERPLYDSEMNLSEAGAATTLDDNDLNALLARFGGAP